MTVLDTPFVGAIAALTFVASAPASAAPDALAVEHDHRVWLEVAAYYPVVDTDVRIDDLRTVGTGSDIDFEADLDFATRRALPSLSTGVRLGSFWRVVGDYYRLARSSSATIDEEFEFDGIIYPVGVDVDATFRSEVFRVAVGRTLFKRSNVELGASLGAHVTSFSVSVAGEGTLGATDGTLERRKRKILAPLPTIGVFAEWKLAPRVEASVKVDALSIKLGDYKGTLINGQASVSYALSRRFAGGLMWRHVQYRLDVEKSEWVGRLRYGYSGPGVFVQARF